MKGQEKDLGLHGEESELSHVQIQDGKRHRVSRELPRVAGTWKAPVENWRTLLVAGRVFLLFNSLPYLKRERQ